MIQFLIRTDYQQKIWKSENPTKNQKYILIVFSILLDHYFVTFDEIEDILSSWSIKCFKWSHMYDLIQTSIIINLNKDSTQ